MASNINTERELPRLYFPGSVEQDIPKQEKDDPLSKLLDIILFVVFIAGVALILTNMPEKMRIVERDLDRTQNKKNEEHMYGSSEKSLQRGHVPKSLVQVEPHLLPHATPSKLGSEFLEKFKRGRRFYHGSLASKNIQVNQNTENMSIKDLKTGVTAALVGATGITPSGGGKDKSQVVKVKSNKDGKYYFIAADLPERKRAADKLAEVHRRSQYLLQALNEQLSEGKQIIANDGSDITANMERLVDAHYGVDTPFAEYHNPSDLTVGSNSEKGMMIEMCLRNKYNPKQWNSDNTLFRVHMHELAHSADFEFRGDGEAAHGPVFKKLHQYLLKTAENLNLYSCAEYKKSGKSYCGLKLEENYC